MNSVTELCNPWAQQNRFEFMRWLDFLRIYDVRSILEIGSCLGHSMTAMCRIMPKGSRIVSVDLGVGAGDLAGVETEQYLRGKSALLGREGWDSYLILGNSHDPEVIQKAAAFGPYDACFIDGDHTFNGVAADWRNYGRFASMTALHDIYNSATEVPQFWQQLIDVENRAFIELRGSRMGIGIVFNAVRREGNTGSEFRGWK